MPRLPLFQSLDVLSHADDVDFATRANRDIETLVFGHQAEQDIQALSALPTLSVGRPGTAPVGQEQPSIAQPSAPASDLPIVTGPRPEITSLQTPQAQASETPDGGQPAWTDQNTTESSTDLGTTSATPSAFPSSDQSTGAPASAPVTSSGANTSAAVTPTPPTASSPTSAQPDSSGLRAQARAEAIKQGLDPDLYERQIDQESQFDPNAVNPNSGARGLAQFMPATARGLGINPMNPGEALAGGARYLRQLLDQFGGDYTKALAAYNWGPGNVAQWSGALADLPGETRTYLQRILGGGQEQDATRTVHQPAAIPFPEQSPNGTVPSDSRGITATQQASKPSAYAPGSYTPNQIDAATSEGLDYETALAVCGPAAAIAFARKTGRNPTMQEALGLARQAGWTVGAGMAGPASEQQLLRSMGVAARLQDGEPDWGAVAADVQRGNPVIVSTPGHYFVAEQYDPATGKFNFGQSAAILKKAGGQTWFTPAEMASLGMGAPRASLFMDNPATPAPSVVAGSSPAAALTAAGVRNGPSTPTGSVADQPPTMYRQPLSQPTPGDAYPLTDVSQESADQQNNDAAPGPVSQPTETTAAGPTFQDDYTQNGQVSPWTQSATTPSDPTMYPSSIPVASPGRTSTAATQPISTPMAQTIPNEDQTSYPLPDYRTPASPLVEAPSNDRNSAVVSPASPYDPAQQTSMEPQPTRFSAPSESPMQPLYDLGGRLIGYVQAGAQAVDRSLNAPVAPAGSPQARALQSVGIDPSWVGNPIAAAERTVRDLPGRVAQLPEINRQAVKEAADEIIQSARATGQAVNEDDVLGAVWNGAMTALSTVNAGVNVLGADINALAPDERIGPVGVGDILTNVNLPQDVRHLAQGAGRMIAAGRRVTPDVIASLRSGVSDVRSGLAANAERTAALDAERAGQAGISAPGVFGVAPPEAGPAAEAVARPRFVPPEERMRTTPNLELPDDPRLQQAVEAAGGTISDRGIEIHTTRAQDAAAAGQTATRGGVFAEAVPPGGRSSYARETPSAGGVGGDQVIPPTPTLYRKPIVLDSEPGTDEGFNQAMRQLGIRPDLSTFIEAAQQRLAQAQNAYEKQQAQKTLDSLISRVLGVDVVDRGIRQARAAGPEGSPARAAALKELVSRYGGDPSLIDPLLQIRGADASESAWAIKENIVAANARRQGYDGVFTIKTDDVPPYPEIAAHPDVAQAKAAVDAAHAAFIQNDQAIQTYARRFFRDNEPGANILEDTGYQELAMRGGDLDAQRKAAQEALTAAHAKATAEWTPKPKISEIFDVQQGRNPTPGTHPDVAELERRVGLARQRRDALAAVPRSERGPEHDQEFANAARALAIGEDQLRSMRQDFPPAAPGYSLHPDVAARVQPTGSTTAAATAGITPVPVRAHTDVLASVNKALSQGVASAVSGGVGAATNQQLNPDDPNAALKGFAVGAVAPLAISRGARALSRVAGREAVPAEGALATFGAAPGPRRFSAPEEALAASHGAIGTPAPVSPNAGVSRLEAARRWIVRQATDNRVDLATLQQDAQRTLGRPLTADEMILEQSRRNSAGATKVMIDERIKPVLQGLDDQKPVVTLPNGKTLTQRSALTQAMVLTSNRNVAIALNTPARVFSGGLTGADSEAALQHLISSMAPEDQRAVASGMRDLNGVVETYRQKLVDSGVWSQAFADEMRQQYPNWVPTKILDYMADADRGAGVGTRSISMRDRGVRQYTLEGTLKSREDPIASLVRYVDESEKRIQQNEVFNGFANLYDALKSNPDSGWANLVREVPNSATAASGRGERTIQGFVDGERKTYIASPSVAAAVRMEQGAQIPIIREVTGLFRELITRTPVFVAGQIPLDAMSAIVRTSNLEGGPQHVPRVAAEIVKGYAEAFRGLLSGEFKGDAARYMQEGGAMAGFYQRGIDAASHTVDSLTRRSMVEINNAGDAANLVKWLAGGGWVQAVGQRVELAPRIAAFRMGEQRALRAGADPARAALEGTMAGRNVTMDFQVGGAAAKVINQAVPFFNVGVQSSVTLARMARENPKAFPFTMAALVAAPTVAAEAWNRSDPQRAADYADVPDYIKDRGIVFMLPGVTGTDQQGNPKPNYAIIPLRELAPISIMTRELAANAMRAAGMHGADEPRGWSALLGAAISAASPMQANSAADLFSSVNPVGINTGLQLATNRDYFRNRDIATERNDQNASALASGTASAVNALTGSQVRPSQADFAIRDLTGGVGAAASAASDLATGHTRDEQRIQNTPAVGGLINRFVGDATGQQLQTARDAMLSPDVQAIIAEAGLRRDQVAPVPSVVQNVPLTQAEQADAQTRMNDYLAEELQRAQNGAAWQKDSQQAAQAAIGRARARATTEILRGIPMDERQQRVQAAQQRKAS